MCAAKRKRYHCSLINVRFVKPFDQDILKQMSRAHRLFVSIEEGLLDGGYGEKIANYAARERMDVCVLQNGFRMNMWNMVCGVVEKRSASGCGFDC